MGNLNLIFFMVSLFGTDWQIAQCKRNKVNISISVQGIPRCLAYSLVANFDKT